MPKGNVYLPTINFQVIFNTLIEVVSVGKFHESHPTNLLSSMDDHGENIVPFEYVQKPSICRTNVFFHQKGEYRSTFRP